MDKRTGRKQITDCQPLEYVGLPSYTLEEALEFVMKVKRAKNLKERTIDGYIQNMRYFNEWVTERYGELVVQDVTAAIIREYVLWCADEKEYYGGHPYKAEYDKERRGLSPASVNVRIRVLRTFFAGTLCGRGNRQESGSKCLSNASGRGYCPTVNRG